MDAVLMASWTAGWAAAPTVDQTSIAHAREAVHAAGAGLSRPLVESVAAAASELCRNQLRHARRGQFAVRAISRDGIPGLEILAADGGDGIADPAGALDRGAPSADAGLAGARRMTQEMDIDVRRGEGTAIRARAFEREVRRCREVGVYGQGLPLEHMSGDHAAWVRDDASLLVTVVDGVGHGRLARDAAAKAVATFQEHAGETPVEILKATDTALAGMRGAVMAVVRVREARGLAEHAAVGNVTTRVERYHTARMYTGVPATLGLHLARRRPYEETIRLDTDEILLLYTDGLRTRVDLSEDPELLREHPVVIAQRAVERFSRTNDDALALVAR